jgi:2-desacetyl-2-hydroxyethyl bacteriochlorophyllide A dehydrogenase
MKGLLCSAPGELGLVDNLPEPGQPGPGWALVEVSHVGICGTDFHIFEGKHPFLKYPRVMGHEVSGRVLQAGDGVNLAAGTPVIVNPYFSCGTCIACRNGKPNCCAIIEVLGVHRDGAMCERILVPAGNLYSAGNLSLRDAATVEFLAIGAHAVRRSQVAAGSRALIIGAGPIGLGTAIFSRIAGHDVTMLDISAERLAFASQTLGFTSTLQSGTDLIDRIALLTHAEGFELVFDATGNARSMQSAFVHVAQGGTLVFVSVVRDNITFSDPEFHKREMTLIGSRNATRQDFEHVAASIAAGHVPVDALVTHVTDLEHAATNLPRWATEKTGLIKAIIAINP